MARKRPATGLASGHSNESTSAGTRRRCCSASSAPRPSATPSAKGTRLVNRSAPVPAPNQRAPQRARGEPNQPRASGSNRAAEATDEIASVTGGGSRPGGGGGSPPLGGGGGAPRHPA